MPRIPHKKQTNLPDEIMTTEDSRTDRIIVALAYLAAIFIPLAAVLIIGEQTGVISKLFETV